MKLKFVKERETKNTVRYSELPEDGSAPAIVTLYVQKTTLREFEGLAGSGAPEYLYVEITAG